MDRAERRVTHGKQSIFKTTLKFLLTATNPRLELLAVAQGFFKSTHCGKEREPLILYPCPIFPSWCGNAQILEPSSEMGGILSV